MFLKSAAEDKLIWFEYELRLLYNLANAIKCVWRLMNVTFTFLSLSLFFYCCGGTIQSCGALRVDLQSGSFLKPFLSPLASLETLSIARNVLITMTKNHMRFSQRAKQQQQQQFLSNNYMHVWQWARLTLHSIPNV